MPPGPVEYYPLPVAYDKTYMNIMNRFNQNHNLKVNKDF